MAYLVPRILNIDVAPDDGATSYAVWVVPAGAVVDYDTPYWESPVATGINLGILTEGSLVEGMYDVKVASKDDTGNMSDIVVIVENFPFDMSAPLAPISGSVF